MTNTDDLLSRIKTLEAELADARAELSYAFGHMEILVQQRDEARVALCENSDVVVSEILLAEAEEAGRVSGYREGLRCGQSVGRSQGLDEAVEIIGNMDRHRLVMMGPGLGIAAIRQRIQEQADAAREDHGYDAVFTALEHGMELGQKAGRIGMLRDLAIGLQFERESLLQVIEAAEPEQRRDFHMMGAQVYVTAQEALRALADLGDEGAIQMVHGDD
jgi:hypothetical protein